MKRLLLPAAGTLLFSLFSVNMQAQQLQNPCGSGIPSQQWEEELQLAITKMKQESEKNHAKLVLRTIPVIIHVIHGGQPVGSYPNLSQGQLSSQIRVLNQDFAGMGFNTGSYNASAFAAFASAQFVNPNSLDAFGRVKIADCFVQFCLATTDTLGNPLPEPGIDRVNYVSKGWTNPAAYSSSSGFKNLMDNTIKPQTVWNVSKYLNIWVSDVNINAIGLLGYATFPPGTTLVGINGSNGTATTDGIWCYARAFGSADYFPLGTYYSSYTRGRTATHEIGHYLGLRHIWGDGTCANDYCSDTPQASDKNFGTPVYPHKTQACNGNTTDGEMFMNFMDYTDDITKYMFTEDQSIRVQTTMNTSPYRKFLGTHNLCSVQAFAAISQFQMPLSVCGTSAAITLTNQSTGVPSPSFTWNVSQGVQVNPNPNSSFASLQFSGPGVYTVTLLAENGTLSTVSNVITVYQPSVTIAGASPLVCEGTDVTLDASGASYYSWFPGSIVSPSIGFNVSGSVTYTCMATSAGNCKTSTVVSIASMDCTGIGQYGGQLPLQLVPNPATDQIRVLNADGMQLNIEVLDIAGRLVRLISLHSDAPREVSLSDLGRGLYIVRIQTENGTSASRLIKE